MNIELQSGTDYRIDVDADLSTFADETDMEINHIFYTFNKTGNEIEISEFLYDFLDTGSINDMEQKIWDKLNDR